MNIYLIAANIFIECETPHVCWAVGIADGYASKAFEDSPAAQKFAYTFAALEAGDDKLQTYRMTDTPDIREFSLLLLAMMAAMED